MSRRTDPPYRAPDEEVGGAPAVLRFILALLTEMAVAVVAGMIAHHYGSRETIDMVAALGIAFPVVIGGLSIVWLELSCHRRNGASPIMLLAEVWL